VSPSAQLSLNTFSEDPEMVECQRCRDDVPKEKTVRDAYFDSRYCLSCAEGGYLSEEDLAERGLEPHAVSSGGESP